MDGWMNGPMWDTERTNCGRSYSLLYQDPKSLRYVSTCGYQAWQTLVSHHVQIRYVSISTQVTLPEPRGMLKLAIQQSHPTEPNLVDRGPNIDWLNGWLGYSCIRKNSDTLSRAEAKWVLKYQNLYQTTSIMELVLHPEPEQKSQRLKWSINILSENEVAAKEIILIQAGTDETGSV